MDYKQKYLKYKEKYLRLKAEMSGGLVTENLIRPAFNPDEDGEEKFNSEIDGLNENDIDYERTVDNLWNIRDDLYIAYQSDNEEIFKNYIELKQKHDAKYQNLSDKDFKLKTLYYDILSIFKSKEKEYNTDKLIQEIQKIKKARAIFSAQMRELNHLWPVKENEFIKNVSLWNIRRIKSDPKTGYDVIPIEKENIKNIDIFYYGIEFGEEHSGYYNNPYLILRIEFQKKK
jgi:hypothetical protein